MAAAFAILAAFGTTQTWVRVLFVSLNGLDADRGLITFIAGLAGAGVCAVRGFGTIRQRWYFGIGGIAAALAVSMPIWFWVEVEDTSTDNEFFSGDLVAIGTGLVLSTIGGIGFSATLVWDFFFGRTAGALVSQPAGAPETMQGSLPEGEPPPAQ